MSALDQQLRVELQVRQDCGLRRQMRVVPPDALDLASNDYLGLARHPDVVEAACRATREFGAGARASRLVCGHTILHEQLERELAEFKGCEAALLFPSGYAANLAVVSALARRGDVILCDKRNHASLIDGCRLAQNQGAVVRYYGSTAKLRALLRRMSTHARASSDVRAEADEDEVREDAAISNRNTRARDGDVRDVSSRAVAMANEAARAVVVPSVSTAVVSSASVWARRIMIVSDAVYSMDGDLADVPMLNGLACEFGATLLLDDAHGTGTLGATGRGTLEHFANRSSHQRGDAASRENQQRDFKRNALHMSTHAPHDLSAASPTSANVNRDFSNVIQVGTLSKALGGQGGFVAGSRALIDWLSNVARPFVYTTALAPGLCGAALEALRIVRNEPQRVARLHENIEQLSQALRDLGFSLPHRDAPILPLVAGSAARALQWSEQLARCGVWCPAIRPPTVPEGASRLRVTVSSALSKDDIARIANAFQTLKESD